MQRGHHKAIFGTTCLGKTWQGGRRGAEKWMAEDRFWSLSSQDLVVGWICGQGKGGLWGDSQISGFSHKMQ